MCWQAGVQPRGGVTEGFRCALMPPTRMTPSQIAAKDVQAWLDAHPFIRDAIRWWFSNGEVLPGIGWPASMWSSFVSAIQVAVNDFPKWIKAYEGTGLPKNEFDTSKNDLALTVWSDAAAFENFTSYVAVAIAAELNGLLPWSLTELDPAGLAVLFDGSKNYKPVHYTSPGAISVATDKYVPFKAMGTKEGYVVQCHNSYTAFVPMHAATVWQWLHANKLVGQTRLQCIVALIAWCLPRTQHSYAPYPAPPSKSGTYGVFTEADSLFQWDYGGGMLQSSVLSGILKSDGKKWSYTYHFVNGCSGAVALLRFMLAPLGVPVAALGGCGHSLPGFLSEGKYLSHGDDIYQKKWTAQELLIDDDKFESWFGQDSYVDVAKDPELMHLGSAPLSVSSFPLCARYVGRRITELAIMKLPDSLLDDMCADLDKGLELFAGDPVVAESARQQSIFAQSLQYEVNVAGKWVSVPAFTLKELNAYAFWQRVQAKLQKTNWCQD